MLTAYNVTSSDGFIASKNGDEDFIPDEVWDDFLELCAQYDTLIIGKNTYATIQSFDKELVEPFEKTNIQKIIVTQDANFVPKSGYKQMSSLQDAVISGSNVLLCSGPALNTAFLKEHLIDRIILNVLPITIGAGIHQFETGTTPELLPLPNLTIEKEAGRKLEFYTVSNE